MEKTQAKNEQPIYEVRKITDIRNLLNQSVKLYADRPAFRIRDKSGAYVPKSYLDFYEDVQALGTGLWEAGYRDCKIAVTGVNSYEWGISYLAVTSGLGVVVPVDKDLPFDEEENILRASETSLIIADKRGIAKLKMHADRLPSGLKIMAMSDEYREEGMESLPEVMENGRKSVRSQAESFQSYWNNPIDPKAMSVLIFTSGTSGTAKGVMLSQENICFDIMSVCSVVKMTPEDQLFSVLPMHHTFECTLGFIAPIYCGACNAFCDSVMRMARDMQTVQPTVFYSVPLMLEKAHDRMVKSVAKDKGGKFGLKVKKTLLKASDAVGLSLSEKYYKEVTKAFGGRLRLIIVGAASVRPDVIKDLKQFGVTSYIGYGLTECAPLVAGNNDSLFTTDTVGKPIPGVSVRIDRPNEKGVGEILVKGPNVMLGYYNNEEETEKVFTEDGWFRTGDLGNIDKDGNIRITGRAKNVIVNANGENIYPEEIEYYLNRNPFILESMVVGSEEAQDGDTVVEAKIFPDIKAIREKSKDGHEPTQEEIWETVNQVIKEINKKLPSYKAIKEFSIRSKEFVKTTTAKIKRFAEENRK